MSIFGGGTLRMRVVMPFPSNVTAGPGIAIDKTSGIWSVSLNFPPLTDGGAPATPSNVYLAGYDTGLQSYNKYRLDNIIAGVTGLDARTPRGDADYSITITDRYIGLTAALTAVRTFTLPDASTVPGGRLVVVQDEVGGISNANYISFVPTGIQTINGVNGAYLLKTKYGGVFLRSNGSNAWNIIASGQRRVVNDAAYTATQGDSIIAYTAVTAARVVTLPAASAYPIGQRLLIVDESGNCSGTNTISAARAGSDTINGSASSVAIAQAYGYLALESDGSSKWTIVDSAGVALPFLASTGHFTSGLTADTTAHIIGQLTADTTAVLTGPVTIGTAPISILNQGRFSRLSATSAQFVPYNGNMIKINGNEYPIPSGGIAGLGNTASCFVNGVASQALAATTFYYVYAFLNSGVITADFSTTAHATSATAGNIGTEIKSGDDTRTLIGAVWSNASSQLVDTASQRFVISWFNRQLKPLTAAFTANRSTASTSVVEINSEIRCFFIAWADAPARMGQVGLITNSGANTTSSAIILDSTATQLGAIGATVASAGVTVGSPPISQQASEGALHFFSIGGLVSAGTGTWGQFGFFFSLYGECWT